MSYLRKQEFHSYRALKKSWVLSKKVKLYLLKQGFATTPQGD